MDLLHLGEEGHQIITVTNLVVFQVDALEVWQLQKLLAGFGIWDEVLLQINVLEVNEAFQTLDSLDHVAGEVDGDQAGQGLKTLDFLDAILMQIDHFQLGEALKVFNLGNTVALEPNTFDI